MQRGGNSKKEKKLPLPNVYVTEQLNHHHQQRFKEEEERTAGGATQHDFEHDLGLF